MSTPEESPISAAVTRAEAFVLREAGPLERAFWQTLLRRQDARPLLAALGDVQGEDGALRPWRDPTPLAATLRGLTWLDALGLLDHPVPERAVGYLLARQGSDGGWTEPGASEAQCIALSGETTGLLAKTPYARASALRRAEGFLAEHWKVERVQGPTYAPILAYVHALAHLHSEIADEALQWCGRELERGYRTQVFPPVAVARVFLRARARALPGLTLEPAELVASLLAAQAADGGWSSDPETPRLDATLEAVEALLRLGGGAA
ncbi:MAG: hypothetical protein ABFS41_12760 [Myxococcota bacterium]